MANFISKLKYFSCNILFLLILLLFVKNTSAAVGCRVINGNTIYRNSNYYLLGVKVNGITIGVGQNIYNLNAPILSNTSCSVPWAGNITVIGSCIYGSPEVAVPLVASVCNNCLVGELVNYSDRVDCPLDDYSWALSASAAVLGFFIVSRRNKR
ncbi:MAG: hypothetical protein EOO93_01375 [Pedobacter sp.]|jgi:hypothetical protein|nr:MAG: hypothetical protein EOO93_01375 [Pedobacter sp.]